MTHSSSSPPLPAPVPATPFASFPAVAGSLLADAADRLGGADLDRLVLLLSDGVPSRERAALGILAKRLTDDDLRDLVHGVPVEIDLGDRVIPSDIVRLAALFENPPTLPVVVVDRRALRAIYWDYEWLCTVRTRSHDVGIHPGWDLRGPAFVRAPGGPDLVDVSSRCAVAPPAVSRVADVYSSSAA